MGAGLRVARRAWLAGVLSLTLAACTHLPPTPVHDASARTWEGQMSVRLDAHAGRPADGSSFTFALTVSPGAAGHLALMTPMGTQVAQVNWTPDSAQLHDGQGQRDYLDLDHLSTALLGEVLPLRALPFWLDGLPDPSLPSSPMAVGFEQAGWQVDLSQFDQQRLKATRAATEQQRGILIRARLTR